LWVSGTDRDAGDGTDLRLFNEVRRYHPIPSLLPVGSEEGSCRDGADNDRDGLTDCADPDCATDVGAVEGGGAISDIVDTTWLAYHDSSCGGSRNAKDTIYEWQAPRSGTWEIRSGISDVQIGIEVLDSCAAAATILACDRANLLSSSTESVVQFQAVAGQSYYLFVDAGQNGVLALDVSQIP
jgi:hypothetical protein